MRKRVIKLLKQYYSVTEDLERRVDICTKLVLRILDEDDMVKDLAVKTVEELWFQTMPSQAVTFKGKPPSSSSAQDKTSLLLKVSVIMGVSAYFKDKQSPLEDLLHKIMSSQNPADAPFMHAKYSEICETLIDGLVDASDLPGFVSVGFISKKHHFAHRLICVLDGSILHQNALSVCNRISVCTVWQQCFHTTPILEEPCFRSYEPVGCMQHVLISLRSPRSWP